MSTALWILIYVVVNGKDPQAVSSAGHFGSRAQCEAAAEAVGLPRMKNIVYVCSKRMII